LDPIELGVNGEGNIQQTQGDLVGMDQHKGAHDKNDSI
jgi:hypothetical protein